MGAASQVTALDDGSDARKPLLKIVSNSGTAASYSHGAGQVGQDHRPCGTRRANCFRPYRRYLLTFPTAFHCDT
jgi:hypothetical protein